MKLLAPIRKSLGGTLLVAATFLSLGIATPAYSQAPPTTGTEAILEQVTTGPVVNDAEHDFGSAWIDYDADGWPDLVAAAGSNFGGLPPKIIYSITITRMALSAWRRLRR